MLPADDKSTVEPKGSFSQKLKWRLLSSVAQVVRVTFPKNSKRRQALNILLLTVTKAVPSKAHKLRLLVSAPPVVPKRAGHLFVPHYEAVCRRKWAVNGWSLGWQGIPHDLCAYPLGPGVAVEFSFLCTQPNLCGIKFNFGTYGRGNDCRIVFTLREESRDGAIVEKQIFSALPLEDNKEYYLSFKQQENSQGRWFFVSLSSPDANATNCVALWGSFRLRESSSREWVGYSWQGPKLDTSDYGGSNGLLPEYFFNASTEQKLHALLITDQFEALHHKTEWERFCNELSTELKVTAVTEVDLENLPHEMRSFNLVVLYRVNPKEISSEFLKAWHGAGIPVALLMEQNPKDTGLASKRVASLQYRRLAQRVDCVLWPANQPSPAFGAREVVCFNSALITNEVLSEVVTLYRRRRLPRVSILSILYAKEDALPFFFECLLKQTYQGPIEVILVDDKSPDGSVRVAEELIQKSHSQKAAGNITFKVLRNEENLGNCASRNRAWQEASGDIVIIVDSDCLLNREFVQAHVAMHDSKNTAVVVGPYNLETHGAEPFRVLNRLSLDKALTEHLAEIQDPLNPSGFLNCITRNFSIKKSAYTEMLFDPEFSYSANPDSGFGWEDVEMGFRLYKRGLRIAYTTNAVSIHITHPSAVDERSKPLRSLKNFRRLIEKHPELALIARRWAHLTYEILCGWLDACGHKDVPDRTFLNSKLISEKHRNKRAPKKLRVLSYRWHCAHQYELYKLPHDFTLITDLGTQMSVGWDYDARPLRPNARLLPFGAVNPDDFDVAILHFDENVLNPEYTNGVISDDWGKSFKYMRQNLKVPMVAICHGTPQFVGMYNLNYSGADLGKVMEPTRESLVEFLGDIPVVLNSHQAKKGWGFKNSRVIWHGFDPTEFPQSTYRKGILSLGGSLKERPHYRGYYLYREVFESFPAEFEPESLDVPVPDSWIEPNSNGYARMKFRNYVDNIRDYSVYFNPTLRSPMPRSRGEAMMCGLATVSARNHDVDMFIKNGENGFYSDEPAELREYLLFLMRNPEKAREIGERGRALAIDLFNHDRYLNAWQELLGEVV